MIRLATIALWASLGCVLAAPRAHAQSEASEAVPAADAPAEADVADDTQVAIVDEGFADACRGAGRSLDLLGADPGRSLRSHEHGYWLPLGACGHDWDVGLEAGFGHAFVGGLRARGVALRLNRTFLAFGTAFATTWIGHDAAVTGTALEAIAGATSSSNRWTVWITATYVLPAGVSGSPTDWNVAAAGVLTDRPSDATRAMPRGPVTTIASFDVQVRTADAGWMALGHLTMRGGYVQAYSQFGELSGYTGALALELFAAHAPDLRTDPLAAWRFGLRAEVDLSTFWPSDTVAPWAASLLVGWAPDPHVTLEAWIGMSDFALSSRTDLPDFGPLGGFRLGFRG